MHGCGSLRTGRFRSTSVYRLIAKPQRSEFAHAVSDRRLNWQPLHAGSAVEADNALCMVKDVLRVSRLGDGAAVTEDENVLVPSLRRIMHRLNAVGRFFERQRR